MRIRDKVFAIGLLIVLSVLAYLTNLPVKIAEPIIKDKDPILYALISSSTTTISTTASTTSTSTTTTLSTTSTSTTTESTTEYIEFNTGPHVMEPVEHEPNEFPTDTFMYKGSTIKLGSDVSAAVKAFGYPENVSVKESSVEATTNEVGTTEDDQAENEYIVEGNKYKYSGFTITVNNDKKITKIAVTDPSIATPKGILPINKYIWEVTSRYGAPSALDDDNSIYYYDVTRNTYMYFSCPNGFTDEWGVALR